MKGNKHEILNVCVGKEDHDHENISGGVCAERLLLFVFWGVGYLLFFYVIVLICNIISVAFFQPLTNTTNPLSHSYDNIQLIPFPPTPPCPRYII